VFDQEPSTWAKVRATLLVIVILTQVFLALPLPHRVSESTLKRPEAKEEFSRWMSLIHGVGLDWTRNEVKTGLISWTHSIADTHKSISRPLKPFRTYLGIGQSWALFAAPDTHPNRLEVAARIDGNWEMVFRRIDPEHTLMKPQISFRRVRGIHDGVGNRPGKVYRAFCDFIAAGMFDAKPGADAVRIRMYRHHVAPPHKPPVDDVHLRHTVVVTREDLETRP
jgi:hypothetical protein